MKTVIIKGLHFRYFDRGVHRVPVREQNKSRLILHSRKLVLNLEGCIPDEKEEKTINP